MSTTYKSGAFAQQCFASHPLCLALKRFTIGQLLVLACSSCHFQHHIRLKNVAAQAAAASHDVAEPIAGADTAQEQLGHCAREHPAAVRVTGMDVLQDVVGLRCGECRRGYMIEARAFETHAR